jgi:S-DNA-T family DNA segregation ATPase FtsK/SpoIIIE
VVVVDEFQEIGATLREFLPELTRLAAQGRSLGMHLILATQRPSGAVTPDIRANTGVTIALRVASEAESRDLVGTGAAAAIPPDAPGRGIVAWGHSRIEIQVALPIATRTPAVRLAGASDPTEPQHLAELVLQQHAHCARSQPLWHAPLPAHIDCLALQGTRGIPMGIADHAASRSRSTLEWIPQLGPLAVVGTPGRERTAALECAAAGASAIGCVAVWLPSDPRRAARTLALSHGRPDVVLLLEDVTKTLAVLSAVDRGAAAEALIARASGGGALAFGIGAGAPHRIAANASLRLVLAGASPHDDALWSVPRELQGLAHEPFLARAHDAHGWREARIAEAATASHECLAKPLPAHVDREQLASARGVGIGGDAAREIVLRPDVSVTVVGVPGTERDNAVAVLQAAGAQSVQCADAPILMPPRARDGIVVATEPTPRIAEELCRGITGGLVEPTTLPGRVLWVDAGVGACVQLVSLAHVSAPVSN